MRYQNRTSNDCRVSNLNKSELDIFVNKALLIVISTIYENELLSKENLEIFKTGDVPLKDLKICTGITLIIDENLKTLHPELCIIPEDSLNKFKEDIIRDF